MFLIFKKKKIVIDCFTKYPYVKEYSPIQKSANFFPEWWKNLNSYYDFSNKNGVITKNSTIKKCNGLIDHYKTGFIVPIWSDLSIKVIDESYSYQFSDRLSEIHNHSRLQFESPVFDNLIHGKIITPWLMKEKTGIKFTLMQPLWNHIDLWDKLLIPPGLLNFSYQYGGMCPNVNFFIPKGEKEIFIAHGTPLVHIIPNSDNDIEIKNHLIDEKEYDNMTNNLFGKTITFTNKYKNQKRIIDKNKKCPFGFGR